MRLEGKVALITGASQGIGQEIAIHLASEGADIIVDYRSDADLTGANQTKAAIEKTGRQCLLVEADLSKSAEIEALIEAGFKKMGGLDVLINNAGIERYASFWEMEEKDLDDVLNVNLRGVILTTQGFVKHLIAEKKPGKVINLSSVHEELPFPHFTSYCVSKGGIKMMTRNLAIELAPFGITINSIAPGAIETPINSKLLHDKEKLDALLNNIPLRRLGTPRDVSNVAVFLASSESDYMTGTTVFVDGWLLWNYQEQ
jgi:glucose 1-dehydrogenase